MNNPKIRQRLLEEEILGHDIQGPSDILLLSYIS